MSIVFNIAYGVCFFQRTLRTVLSYTPCRDDIQQRRLQALLSPVLDTILLKCADSNKYVKLCLINVVMLSLFIKKILHNSPDAC